MLHREEQVKEIIELVKAAKKRELRIIYVFVVTLLKK